MAQNEALERLEREVARELAALRAIPTSDGPATETALRTAAAALDRLRSLAAEAAAGGRQSPLQRVRMAEEELQGRRMQLQQARAVAEAAARARLLGPASGRSSAGAREEEQYAADVEDADESAGLLREQRVSSKVGRARAALALAEGIAGATVAELDRHGERLGRTRQKLETAGERLGAHQRRTREAVAGSRVERRKLLAGAAVLVLVCLIAAWWRWRDR
eukprot:tig00020812_g14080.t1